VKTRHAGVFASPKKYNWGKALTNMGWVFTFSSNSRIFQVEGALEFPISRGREKRREKKKKGGRKRETG
jgi:hypothetical protein